MKKTILVLTVLFLGIFLIGFQNAIACGSPGCEPCLGTGTPGYWKNHPEAWDDVDLTSLGIGTQQEALDILNLPVKGDKWITMFKAAVAAGLNYRTQNCCLPYANYYDRGNNCVVDALYWLNSFSDERPVKANSEAWQYSHGEDIYWCLDDYNNGGFFCAPSRDSLE